MEVLSELAKFGMLGLVLGWLALKHLPAKDAQIQSLIARSDKRLDELATQFKEDLESVIRHCSEENKAILARIDRLTEALTERFLK